MPMFVKPPLAFRNTFARSLRIRVVVLTIAAFVAVAIPASISYVWIINSTIVKLGTLFAEKQILYDRYRGLEALTREAALAETLARSPVIIEWAEDESDLGKRRRGLAELEHYREAFADHSYFFAVDKSGNYYFNDSDGSYTGDQKRYTLSRINPRDGWYYKTATLGAGCQLNVDQDDNLAVTKVWINCVVQKNGDVKGILGTGLDLTTFLREVVESDQKGVDSMFVDQFGSVQANRNKSLIDYHSLTKESGDRKTFFHMLGDARERLAFRDMMANVKEGETNAEARFLHVDGRKMLVGVGFLDKLGWYNVTVMNIDKIIDRWLFGPIAVLLALVMVAATALMTWLFKRSVLDRLARAERSVERIELGDFSTSLDDGRPDEIGRLSGALNRMAHSVGNDRARLEAAVRERTEELEHIAYLDPLTGLLNRRGFVEAFAQLKGRKGDGQLGLLILDADGLKAINDQQGHLFGDVIIRDIAQRLLAVSRPGDFCARWGGDEFVAILKHCDTATLEKIAAGLLESVREQTCRMPDRMMPRITISIGAHVVAPEDTVDSAAAKADLALYAAKRHGRNRVVVYDGTRHGSLGATSEVA